MTGMGLLQRSFYGGILILVILAVRILWLDKLPKRTMPVLWGVALLRLLAPFSVPSACSVYSILRRIMGMTAPEQGLSEISVGREWEMISVVPQSVAENASAAHNSPVWGGVQSLMPEQRILAATPESWISVLPVIWCVGMVCLAVFFGAAYFRSLRSFRGAVPVEDERVRRWLDGHRAGRFVSVRRLPQIPAPLTYGCLRPVILLPDKVLEGDSRELEYILQHEYVHICHFDTALKLAMTAALCIHWFNPLVWAMTGLLSRDIELACDEGVLHRFGERARVGYAMALIGMEEKKRRPMPIYNGFSKNATEERINLIMRYQKIKYATAVAATALVVVVAVVFATSAKKAEAMVNTEEMGEPSAAGNPAEDSMGTEFEDIPLDPPKAGWSGTDRGENLSSIAGNGLQPDDQAFALGSEDESDGVAGGASSSGASNYALRYDVEGMPEEVPATLYEGTGYRLLVPKDWSGYAPDAWKWDVNELVQFWVSDFGGNTREQAIAKLEEQGYVGTEESGVLKMESDGRRFFAQIRTNGSLSTMCVNYAYPAEPEYEEGIGSLLSAMARYFAMLPIDGEESLSEDGAQLRLLAETFWKAYLAGESENLRQCLSEDYSGSVDTFPDGQDGHVREEAMLQAVKGWNVEEKAVGEDCEIWLEFRPAASADTLEYLTLHAVKRQEGWKIDSYGLER